MTEEELKEIEEFLKAANRTLGDNKYKPTDLVIDYCRAVRDGQSLIKAVRDRDDKITRLIFHTKWMLAEMDYRNTQTGIDSADSPEVKELRGLLDGLKGLRDD